jgi:O-antigen/teichoic acid export membrane protein
MMRRLASDSLIYGLGSVANQLLAIVLLPLYTRFLDPSVYGTLALISAAGAVLQLVAALGVSSGMTRIFFLHAEADRGRLVFTAFVFAVACAGAVAGALVALAPEFARALLGSAEGASWVRLAILNYALGAVNMVSLGALQVYRRPRAFVACSALGLLSSCAASIYLVAFAGRGLTGVLEGQLIGMAVQLALGTAASLSRLVPRLHLGGLREMLFFAIPLLPTGLFAWALGLSDRYFLNRYATLTEVGLYALGFRFGVALDTLLVSPFMLAWFPYIYSIQDQPEHKEICARVLEYYTLAAACLVLALALFGSDVIRLIADPSYLDADRVIFWIGLGVLFRGMNILTSTGMNLVKRNVWSIAVYGAGLVANLALLRLLVPGGAMMGAAAAVCATYLIVTAGFWIVSQRLYPLPFRLGKLALVVLAAIAFYAASRLVPEEPRLLAFALKSALVVGFPLALFAVRFFDSRDIDRLRALLSGLRPA